MRYASIKEASQDEQQNQTTTTTNINLVRFKKQNLISKSKYRQIKQKLNKITCSSPEKIWDESIIRLGNNKTIKKKIVRFKNSLILKKTINFKAMKTLRNHSKYPLGLQLKMLL